MDWGSSDPTLLYPSQLYSDAFDLAVNQPLSCSQYVGGTGLLCVALVPSWSLSSCRPASARRLGDGRNPLPSLPALEQLGQGEGDRNVVPRITQ